MNPVLAAIKATPIAAVLARKAIRVRRRARLTAFSFFKRFLRVGFIYGSLVSALPSQGDACWLVKRSRIISPTR